MGAPGFYKIAEIARLTGYSRGHLYYLADLTDTLGGRTKFTVMRFRQPQLRQGYETEDVRQFCLALLQLRSVFVDMDAPLAELLEAVKKLPRRGGVQR